MSRAFVAPAQYLACVVGLMHAKFVEDQSSHVGVVWKLGEGVPAPDCHDLTRHLTMVQNYEVRRQQPSPCSRRAFSGNMLEHMTSRQPRVRYIDHQAASPYTPLLLYSGTLINNPYRTKISLNVVVVTNALIGEAPRSRPTNRGWAK
ncbi:hypothetical protein TNCV_4289661 [Trichonephila clavipes]|nr:hypothetical protein TNCV_4289661 [Trichonephila clavipes]